MGKYIISVMCAYIVLVCASVWLIFDAISHFDIKEAGKWLGEKQKEINQGYEEGIKR